MEQHIIAMEDLKQANKANSPFSPAWRDNITRQRRLEDVMHWEGSDHVVDRNSWINCPACCRARRYLRISH